MTRRHSALTSSPTPQAERTARRIVRQQKRLEHELPITDIPQNTRRRAISIKHSDLPELLPLTDTQADFFDAYEHNDVTGYVLYGSAGTGKTLIAMWHALNDVLDPTTPYKRLVIIRSTVEVRSVGFMPGDYDEKIAPYEHPYEAICNSLFKHQDAYEKLKDIGAIKFMSTTFLRGDTFNDSIVYLDECQNCTLSELNTVMTRLGCDSKIIVSGDSAQGDLNKRPNEVSGFRDFIDISKRMPEFRHFRFTSDDIVRSGFVKSWIVNYERVCS